MKEKIKTLWPHLLVALAGGVLPLLIALIWQQHLRLNVFSMILLCVPFCLVLFLLLHDAFYRRCNKALKRSIAWALGGLAVFLAIVVLAFGLVMHVLQLGSLIALIVFGAVVCILTALVYVFAVVCALIPLQKMERACVSVVALVSVLAVVLPLVIAPVSLFNGYRSRRVQYGTPSEEVFATTDTFSLSDGIQLQKDPNKDFVVLNLADIQLTDSDFSILTGVAAETFAYIEELVERTTPDLITISGDTGCGYEGSTRAIATFIDSFDIPWAPVFGNHDHEIHDIDANYAAEIFMSYENCLFKKGPVNLGVGNYMIHVMEGNTLLYTFFMMDTHDHATYRVEEDGETVEVYGYDHFWNGKNQQLDWYEWAVSGITKYAGKIVPSTVIAHIPVVQFEDAFLEAWNSVDVPDYSSYEEYKNGNYHYNTAFGVFWDSGVAAAPVDNGFFDLMKQLGSTEHFVAGHDHTNNYSVMYEGIRLTYALKTGSGCYWDERLNGGTTLTLGANGHVTVAHVYIEGK